MTKKRIVHQGEHLSGISRQHGLTPEKVWNLPENAELKQKRDDHDVLFPGDALVLPDIEIGDKSGSTEETHRFVRMYDAADPRPEVLATANRTLE